MHGFDHVNFWPNFAESLYKLKVIRQNWAKNLQNMGVAVPWPPVGTRSPEPPRKFRQGP